MGTMAGPLDLDHLYFTVLLVIGDDDGWPAVGMMAVVGMARVAVVVAAAVLGVWTVEDMGEPGRTAVIAVVVEPVIAQAARMVGVVRGIDENRRTRAQRTATDSDQKSQNYQLGHS